MPIMWLFGAVFALVALLWVISLRVSGRQGGGLPVDNARDINDRHFALVLRRLLAPALDSTWGEPREDGWRFGTVMMNRSPERVGVYRGALRLGDLPTPVTAIVVDGDLEVPDGTRLACDIWCRGNISVGPNCIVRGIAGDGAVQVGANTVIQRWVDASTTLDLGQSVTVSFAASAGKEVLLGVGFEGGQVSAPVVRFAVHDEEQMRGQVLVEHASHWLAVREEHCASLTAGSAAVTAPGGSIPWVQAASTFTSGQYWIGPGSVILHDIVSRGQVTVGPGSVVAGSIHSEGDVHIGREALVAGRVACRHLILDPRATVAGSVHADGHVVVGDGGMAGLIPTAGGLSATGSVYLLGSAEVGQRVTAAGRIVSGEEAPEVRGLRSPLLHRVRLYFQRRARLMLGSISLTILSEFLWRQDLGQTMLWLWQNAPLFALSLLLLFGALAGVAGITGRERLALLLVGLPLLLFAYASGVKMRMLGTPILLSDLYLLKEAGWVAGGSELSAGAALLGWVLALVTGVLLWRGWVTVWAPRERLGHVAAGLLLVSVVAAFPGSLVKGAGGLVGHGPGSLTRADGLVLATLLQTRPRATTAGVADPPFLPGTAQRHSEEVKPNIIVVLSESLWDPTQLANVQFDPDPLPTLHALQQRFPSGSMLTPQFGGGTANVELEVLTGLSMRFLPAGSSAYEQYMTRPVDSLASILARKGYSTTAITPWPKSYFNSDRAYQNMGFARMISAEFMPVQHAGTSDLIADAEMGRQIIAAVESAPGPHFVFANTAQNHYPYQPGRYPDSEVTVTGGLSTESLGMLETYAQGCLDADRMLQRLTEYFAGRAEPTIIVFFGDHLPVIGPDLQVYREAGYVTGHTDPSVLDKLYRTPLLVWDNYLPQSPRNLDISASFIAPYVLERAGLNGTVFTEYLRTFAARMPMLPPVEYWDQWYIDRTEAARYESAVRDILFGSQSSYGDVGRILSPEFSLGPGRMKITEVRLVAEQEEGGLRLRLHGQHLPPRGQVYVGDAPVETVWVEDGSLEVTIPPSLARTRPIRMEVRLADDWNGGYLEISESVQY